MSRRIQIVAGIAISLAAVVIGREVLRQQEFPDAWDTDIVANIANDVIVWSQTNLQGFTSGVNDFLILYLLDLLERLLLEEPWWIVAGHFLLAWRVATWRLALSVFVCFIGIGLLGTWEFSMITPAAGARCGRGHGRVRDPARSSPRRATRSRRSPDRSSTRCRRCRRSST